jgi:triacylglycerol lipase
MTKAAIKAAATGKLPPYSLKSPLLSRVTSEGKSPMQREQQAREDAAEAAERAKSEVKEGSGSSSSLLAFPSMFGSTVTDYLLGILDSPAYGNLTTHFLNETFNPSTPDDPSVKYLSVAGRTNKLSVLHPLWFPKLILDAAAERGYAEEDGKSGREYEGNDGLVSVSSAKWGEWLGTVDKAHHWDLRGEGGLLPDLPTIDDKPEGRPDPNAPGGWDWEWRSDSAVKKVKEKVKGKEKEGEAWLNKQAIERMPEMVKRATASIPNGWDLAQVGQVIDWVGDLMPGSNPDDRAGKRANGSGGDDHQAGSIGARQMADAAREKAGEDQRQTRRDGQKDKMIRDLANDSNMRQTGEMGKREQKVSENTGHFRLDRFYGGLAAKLSEEGF